ncbi:hypothetical protein [Desulfofundulus thermosubterraneus]|uniref:Uncharacterized protein n=1 Tax=Desulfofundulus thermosubterraneus DSM 16057 TaxID=1121432 RepID=A0A1M6DYT3_9FIRM|nr:hypothetical protein [Desulfofundulus thermosubterraneus]SHI78386.1 hypothetical protein SAMN02745219_01060 [Desulfofundulus thermosubterraneus DSM 16057]
MSKNEIRKEQKTFRHELVREESPLELWDLNAKGKHLRENPYKTPPNNLTTKRKDK